MSDTEKCPDCGSGVFEVDDLSKKCHRCGTRWDYGSGHKNKKRAHTFLK